MTKIQKKGAQALTPAQQALITENMLAYAEALVKKQTNNEAEFDELIAMAYLALCEAALNYNAQKGASFKTHATPYILKKIKKANDSVKLKGFTYVGNNKVVAFSLDTPLPNSNSRGSDCLADDEDEQEDIATFVSGLAVLVEQEEARENKTSVSLLLDKLAPRERDIVELYYGLKDGEEKSEMDIAQMLGLTKKRVQQLRDSAEMKMYCLTH